MKETCLISLKKGMTMFRPRKIHITSLLLALVAASPLGRNLPAFADVPTGAVKPLPADVQAIMSQLNDLDLLVVLAPLKLTGEQIDKILGVLEPISKSDDDITKEQCDTMRGVAADIDKARADTLKGNSPDPDVTAKINKILADFGTKNIAAHKDATDKVVDAAKSTLTPDQIKIIEHKYTEWMGGKLTLPAEYRDDAAKRSQYVEDLALTAFVGRVFLVQRTIPLLKALKTSAPSAAGAGDKSNAAAPPSAAPPAK